MPTPKKTTQSSSKPKSRNTAKGTAKKASLSSREIVMIVLIAVLLIALVVTLTLGDNLKALLGTGNDDVPSDDKIYTSVLSGKANITLPAQFDTDQCLEVHFIDVGQGDAIVIMLPDGKTMLIDAGSGTGAYTDSMNMVSSAIREQYYGYLTDNLNLIAGTDVIDYLIVTHQDADHVNLMTKVIQDYDIYNIYYNDLSYPGMNAANVPTTPSATYKYFMATAEAETTATRHDIGSAEERIEIPGDTYSLTVYAPGNSGLDNKNDAYIKNSMSILCLLEYGERRVLFTGDGTVKTEEWFMDKLGGTTYDIDVLKLGHHGSDSSSSLAFLQYLLPEYTVISSDNGSAHGHPTPLVMNRLFDEGIVTFRTNRHGSIVLYIDSDGDFAFLPEKNVQAENNTKGRDQFTILLDSIQAA